MVERCLELANVFISTSMTRVATLMTLNPEDQSERYLIVVPAPGFALSQWTGHVALCMHCSWVMPKLSKHSTQSFTLLLCRLLKLRDRSHDPRPDRLAGVVGCASRLPGLHEPCTPMSHWRVCQRDEAMIRDWQNGNPNSRPFASSHVIEATR